MTKESKPYEGSSNGGVLQISKSLLFKIYKRPCKNDRHVYK